MLDQLIAPVRAGRAFSANDDADMDEGSVSDVVVLEPVCDRARVAEGRGTERLDVLRLGTPVCVASSSSPSVL